MAPEHKVDAQPCVCPFLCLSVAYATTVVCCVLLGVSRTLLLHNSAGTGGRRRHQEVLTLMAPDLPAGQVCHSPAGCHSVHPLNQLTFGLNLWKGTASQLWTENCVAERTLSAGNRSINELAAGQVVSHKAQLA